MGDLTSSSKQAVVERLQRRFETYKRDHKNAMNRHHYSVSNLNENRKFETNILHEKWLEGKVKKSVKNARIKETSIPTNGIIVQSQGKLKRPKIDVPDTSSSIEPTHFDGKDHVPEVNKAKQNAPIIVEETRKIPRVSSQSDIKLNSPTFTVSASTNLCKKESKDLAQQTSNPSSNDSLSIGIDDVTSIDELQEILDALEQEPDLIKELDSGLKDVDPELLSDKKTDRFQEKKDILNEASDHFDSIGISETALNRNFGERGIHDSPTTQVSLPSFDDAGPAAKTLQQMAAQHQSQQVNLPSKYESGERFVQEGRSTVNSFSHDLPQKYMAPGININYQYSQESKAVPVCMKNITSESKVNSVTMMPFSHAAQTVAVSHYGSTSGNTNVSFTKQRMAAYAKEQSSESQAMASMQMTHSQQMNMGNLCQNMISQDPQFQINYINTHPVPSVVHSQQQTYISEDIKMQTYQNKFNQNSDNISHQNFGRPHMPQRFQHASVTRPELHNSCSLQTMQNILNPTNPRFRYAAFETLQQNNVAKSISFHSSNGMESMTGLNDYSTQVGVVNNMNMKDKTGFTSTLLKGQRPPNVNIGPEGLNISQPHIINTWKAEIPHHVPNSQYRNYNQQRGSQENTVMQECQHQSMHSPKQGTLGQAKMITQYRKEVSQAHVHRDDEIHIHIAESNHAGPFSRMVLPHTGIHHSGPNILDFMDNSQHVTSDLFESLPPVSQSSYNNIIDDILDGQ